MAQRVNEGGSSWHGPDDGPFTGRSPEDSCEARTMASPASRRRQGVLVGRLGRRAAEGTDISTVGRGFGEDLSGPNLLPRGRERRRAHQKAGGWGSGQSPGITTSVTIDDTADRGRHQQVEIGRDRRWTNLPRRPWPLTARATKGALSCLSSARRPRPLPDAERGAYDERTSDQARKAPRPACTRGVRMAR